MFKRQGNKGTGGAGRGKSAILRAQGWVIIPQHFVIYNTCMKVTEFLFLVTITYFCMGTEPNLHNIFKFSQQWLMWLVVSWYLVDSNGSEELFSAWYYLRIKHLCDRFHILNDLRKDTL
jgi:hypothetical protein